MQKKQFSSKQKIWILWENKWEEEDELQANDELAVAHFPADSWTQAERRSNPVTINGPVLGSKLILLDFGFRIKTTRSAVMKVLNSQVTWM